MQSWHNFSAFIHQRTAVFADCSVINIRGSFQISKGLNIFQILLSPLTVVHEEGRTSGPFPDDFLTKTSLTLGQLSVREVLFPDQGSVRGGPSAPAVIPIILFDQVVSSNPYHRPPDLKLVIKVRPATPFVQFIHLFAPEGTPFNILIARVVPYAENYSKVVCQLFNMNTAGNVT